MQNHNEIEDVVRAGMPQRQIEGKWLKLSDAAKTLGVSEITLRRRVKCGRLAFDFRGGKYYVFIPDGIEASHFLDAPDAPAVAAARPVPASAQSRDRASQAANLLRPCAGQFDLQVPAHASPRETRSGDAQSMAPQSSQIPGVAQAALNGPTPDQIIAILKIELGEKDREIICLKRKIADQTTLIAALEASLESFISQQPV